MKPLKDENSKPKETIEERNDMYCTPDELTKEAGKGFYFLNAI